MTHICGPPGSVGKLERLEKSETLFTADKSHSAG
jgi:hypothetical protein